MERTYLVNRRSSSSQGHSVIPLVGLEATSSKVARRKKPGTWGEEAVVGACRESRNLGSFWRHTGIDK